MKIGSRQMQLKIDRILTIPRGYVASLEKARAALRGRGVILPYRLHLTWLALQLLLSGSGRRNLSFVNVGPI